MRRADRLFQIVQILQHRRVTTAARIAERLQVSERTVYRDIRDLSLSGVPIEGEAGVGYRLGKDFELPPLMFTVDEIQALVLGARMVESWGDAQLQQAALSVLEKVEAALPHSERPRVHSTALFSLAFHVPPEVRTRLGQLRHAIADQHHVSLHYRDRQGELTTRSVRPLGLYFWGSTWTLGAYCELREDFRSFRLDRIEDSNVLDTTFELQPPITLADYVRSVAGD
ncbi:helix-turn-helix transcriptional regulator [Paraliomyxa miuraensis]|uniref:helix-turn-helix transcriptional regulator n=1 Tax=Paraliomyxa miuraensis TaxID=376150 RepID=UPI002253A82F|nr:YafY family protein [Paraliomyxa miuraensis]MCX4241915.1 YafY family transcriptional regulator [Paraliomyxa miuraensis]